MLEEYLRCTTALEDIHDPLERFVYVYANVNPKMAERLTKEQDVTEILMFAVWMQACDKLSIKIP
jgi:hypothetical protein